MDVSFQDLIDQAMGKPAPRTDLHIVAVRDTGVGLDADSADQLFQPFYTTKASGMGMGLSICRSIIEAHGGRVVAARNVDAGATFQFTLPVQQEREP